MQAKPFDDHSEVEEFFRRVQGPDARLVRLDVRTLRGGLESEGVFHVTAHFELDSRRRMGSVVVKRLDACRSREARIYKEILHPTIPEFSPALLDVRSEHGVSRLYLEAIRPAVRWPWRETASSSAVLQTMAQLHTSTLQHAGKWDWLSEWNYDSDLARRAQDTVFFVEQSRGNAELAWVRKSLPVMARVASALPKLRHQLLEFAPFRRAFIHGDVHPGNVFIRKTSEGLTPVFIDWARSRVGSPLEDVASWLQSLGSWEPEARRRHDTLLTSYLSAIGHSPRLTRDLRDAYWLAAASNLLAGAILYHLSVFVGPKAVPARRRSAACRALADCLRVLRRADACWS